MKATRFVYLVIPAILILFACSKKGENAQPVLERITPEVVETDLSLSAQAILKSYREKQPLDLALVRDAIYSNHLSIYEAGPGAIPMKNEDLESFTSDTGKGALDNIGALKPLYENRMTDIFKGLTDYESSAVTLGDIKQRNALQCYSGTMLFAVESLAHLPNPLQKNLVVIFESGHVLAGYVELRNGEWYLTGIETTARGKALINYGVFKNVANQIRVVDLELFLVIDAVKYALKNSMEVSNQALTITGAKYGASDVYLLTQEPTVTAQANYSPFQFGAASVQPGRMERKRFELIDRSDLPAYVSGVPQLQVTENRPFESYGGVPGFGGQRQIPFYGGFDRNEMNGETIAIRLMSLQRAAIVNREMNVVVDKKYFQPGWPENTMVLEASEKFLEVIQGPGEIDPRLKATIIEFLDQYSVRSTGER